MPLTIIQMHDAALAATADDIAAVDIPENGAIVAVDWHIQVGGSGFADADHVAVQLSFLSTGQLSQNDARGAISVVGVAAGSLTTSGLAMAAVTKFCAFPEPLEVAGGERLHLHAIVSGTVDTDIWCLIHLRTGKAIARRSRRRR